MALTKTLTFGQPLNQRGQGAIEAIVALPVFLILICMIFQLFLLGVAQIQLQYAAFYAARSGAVNGADEVEMKHTVKRILDSSYGFMSLSGGSVEVEVLSARHEKGNSGGSKSWTNDLPLMVRVHWYHPLIVPFVDRLIPLNSRFMLMGRPNIHLKASWATAIFEEFNGGGDNAGKKL